MKTSKQIGIFLLTSLLLTSCGITSFEHEASSSQTSSSQGSASFSSSSSSSGDQITISSSNRENPNKEGTYTFYCVNDFHGSVLENGDETGLLNYFSFLSNKVEEDPEHTIILSAGDMYQGSYESNSNYGQFVTEAMNAVPFDAMALGNHEFDYGLDRLYANIEKANFPVLAGNIVKYGSSTSWGKTEISTTFEKGNVKIGIVGMIGEGQTTSITSSHVKELDFINPENLALKEATRLRNEENCDIVMLDIHCDASVVNRWSSSSTFSQYFDGAFCAHTHAYNNISIDGVPALQAYCNGKAYSKIAITLDKSGNIASTASSVSYLPSNVETNQKIKGVYDKYINNELKAVTGQAAGTVKGSLSKYGVARLGCKAIYEKYKSDYPGLALAMENSQRSTLSGQITYGDIYKATPFTNRIVIADLKGDEIINEAKYNPTYTGDIETYASLDSSKYYTVAVVDYLYYHQNVSKRYDYFPSLNNLSDRFHGEYETYPADLTFDYVKNTLNGVLNASDYSDTSAGFDLYSKLGK